MEATTAVDGFRWNLSWNDMEVGGSPCKKYEEASEGRK